MKKIPLSSYVMLVGPSGAGKSTLASTRFAPEEIVSTDAIRRELTGDHRRLDHDNDVYEEAFRRIEWRLSRGARAVLDATNIRQKERLLAASSGKKYGVPITYLVVNMPSETKHMLGGWRNAVVADDGKTLIDSHQETFEGQEKEILSGDRANFNKVGPITVIDTRVEKFEVITKMPRDPAGYLYELLKRQYHRIRVIGDVHGNVKGLQKAMDVPEGTYLQFLGDIPDYGKGSLDTVRIVAKAVAEGRAGNIVGNHEHKNFRYIVRERLRLNHLLPNGEPHPKYRGWQGSISHGNAVTFDQIKALGTEARLHYETAFIGLIENSPDFVSIHAENGKFGFIHGAMKPYLFDDTRFRLGEKSSAWTFAMFGQVIEGTITPEGYPLRVYDWVNNIPANHTVFVGHDIQSRIEPTVKTSSSGGRVVFVDTGSAKDGKLSWVDLEITNQDDGFRLDEIGYGSE